MLRSVDEHSAEVRTDPLQVLHVVYNLNDILTRRPPGVGHTLNDSQLHDQVDTLTSSSLSSNIYSVPIKNSSKNIDASQNRPNKRVQAFSSI